MNATIDYIACLLRTISTRVRVGSGKARSMISLADPSYFICQVNNGVELPFKVWAKRHKVKARVERALTHLTGANPAVHARGRSVIAVPVP